MKYVITWQNDLVIQECAYTSDGWSKVLCHAAIYAQLKLSDVFVWKQTNDGGRELIVRMKGE